MASKRRANGERARRQHQRDRDQPGEKQARLRRNRDDLEPDQQEQDRVEHLVDQRPEFEDMVARRVAHRQRDAGIADQQAGDRHRDRAADVEPWARL